ncbi:MAG: hypothetical protein N3E40_05835, partial [Dehalococcoidia bacterium]|nr:hypothetical protein [Dehalococcoidia bacterium]
MYNFEDQMNQFREQARRAGFSGNAIIDVHPSSGIIRIKMAVPPPANLGAVVANYARFVSMSLGAMN